jgi:hypothetical protein
MIDVPPVESGNESGRRRSLIGIVPLLCLALAGCAASPAPAPAATATVPRQPPAAAAQKSPRPKPPLTHVEMKVLDVVPTRQGAAVLLVDEASDKALPIFIGGTEALSIALRHEDRRYERPLTHDLLDTVMQKLGGELIKVHVDELRDGVFIGTIFVRNGQRTLSVDARPSDAIALALGHDVPIFVARQVLDAAGIRRKDLERGGEGPDLPAPPPGGVERL